MFHFPRHIHKTTISRCELARARVMGICIGVLCRSSYAIYHGEEWMQRIVLYTRGYENMDVSRVCEFSCNVFNDCWYSSTSWEKSQNFRNVMFSETETGLNLSSERTKAQLKASYPHVAAVYSQPHVQIISSCSIQLQNHTRNYTQSHQSSRRTCSSAAITIKQALNNH